MSKTLFLWKPPNQRDKCTGKVEEGGKFPRERKAHWAHLKNGGVGGGRGRVCGGGGKNTANQPGRVCFPHYTRGKSHKTIPGKLPKRFPKKKKGQRTHNRGKDKRG